MDQVNIVGMWPNQIETATVYIQDPAVLFRLAADLPDSTKFSPDTFVNYLFFRILLQNSEFVPESRHTIHSFVPILTESFQDTNRKNSFGRKGIRVDPFRVVEASIKRDRSWAVAKCAAETVYSLPLSTGRVFLDAIWPTDVERENLLRLVGFFFLKKMKDKNLNILI